MKVICSIILLLSISFACLAQNKPGFNIKVVEKNKRKTKGVFYAVTIKELILLKHGTDTIKINFSNVKDLYINKRGIVFPFTLAGAGVFIVAAAEAKLPLDQAAYLFVGVPVGIAIGNLVGQLFANKRFYRGLEVADFPNIRTDLEKYTQIITQPSKIN